MYYDDQNHNHGHVFLWHGFLAVLPLFWAWLIGAGALSKWLVLLIAVHAFLQGLFCCISLTIDCLRKTDQRSEPKGPREARDVIK